jgi:hypothetical protein
LNPIYASAQLASTNNPRILAACDEAYSSVEKLPEFSGAEKALLSKVDQIVRGHECFDVETATARFTIDSNGVPFGIQIPEVDSACSNYFAAAFKTLPSWQPGRLRGEKVCISITIPVA